MTMAVEVAVADLHRFILLSAEGGKFTLFVVFVIVV
jgi:hypothetical protein